MSSSSVIKRHRVVPVTGPAHVGGAVEPGETTPRAVPEAAAAAFPPAVAVAGPPPAAPTVRSPARPAGVSGPDPIEMAKAKAERIIGEARARAELIIEQAVQGAEKLAEAAREEALESVRGEMERMLSSAEREADEIRRLAQTEADRWLDEHQAELTRLAVAAAGQILRGELQLHPDRIADIVAQALQQARGRREVTVRVEPGSVAAVESARGRLGLPDLGVETMRLEGDPALRPGDALVLTDHGTIDARLDPQLQRVQAAVTRALDAPADDPENPGDEADADE